MIEIALTFGRTTPARFPPARRLVRWLPGLCEGLLEDCDLAYRPESRLLVVVVRLDRDTPAVVGRLAFWTGRAGGHPTPLVSLGATQRSAYQHLLGACRHHRLGVEPELLEDALQGVAAAVGVAVAPELDAPGPVLYLEEAGEWDGTVYDDERGRLFLPGATVPPLWDELGVRLTGSGPGLPAQSRARVVEVVAPGRRGPGTPAGFTVELEAPPPALRDALARLAAGRPGARRAAPRYPLRVPVSVNVALEDAGDPSGAGVKTLPGRLADLSQGGAYVDTEQPLPPGTEVRLEIRPPGQPGIDVLATVVHDDESGMGVRFRLDEAGEAGLAEVMARMATLQRRVLVVDDDVMARSLVSEALRERGFEVHSATGAAEGLQVLTDELLAFDLLVTDLRMPEMDGESFIRLVRGPGGERDLAVVAMSGTVDPFLEARLRETGADAVLDKGAGAAGIAAEAEAVLERRKTDRD